MTCLFFQNSRKFFKRADLVHKEQEEYFKKCGYKVCVMWSEGHSPYLMSKILFTMYPGIINHSDAQVYMSACVYCAVFPNLPLLPASVGSERDFWKPGMGCKVKIPVWMHDERTKSVPKPSISLTPFLKFHVSDNYNGIMVKIALYFWL